MFIRHFISTYLVDTERLVTHHFDKNQEMTTPPDGYLFRNSSAPHLNMLYVHNNVTSLFFRSCNGMACYLYPSSELKFTGSIISRAIPAAVQNCVRDQISYIQADSDTKCNTPFFTRLAKNLEWRFVTKAFARSII